MKQSVICAVILLAFILFGGCSSNGDWTSSFVVWDGYAYEISDEYVNNIEEEIGRVTKYSDREGTYFGNFSNTYKKGTKYYSIEGISTDEAIAIEEAEGKFRKAIRNGKYREK